MRDNFIHVAFNMLLCKLFSNSLLASLNTRKVLRSDLRGPSKSSGQQSTSRSDPQFTSDITDSRGTFNGARYTAKGNANHLYPPNDNGYDRTPSISDGVKIERTVTGPVTGMVDLKDNTVPRRSDSLYWADE